MDEILKETNGLNRFSPAQNEFERPKIQEKTLYYYIMPKYGYSLEQIFNKHSKQISKKDVCHIGISLLKSLEIIHNSGFIYGDLKLDNIMLGNQWKDKQLTNCEENIF